MYILINVWQGVYDYEKLFYSASIGEKSRENLLKTLNDYLVNLACSKHDFLNLQSMSRGGTLHNSRWPACRTASIPLISTPSITQSGASKRGRPAGFAK